MNRLQSALPLCLLAALAACGNPSETGEAGAPASGRAAVQLDPGQWEHTSTVISAEIPGAPAGMLSGMIGQANIVSTCLTAEQLAEGAEVLFNQSDGQCSYSEFMMEGGRMRMIGSCSAPGGAGQMQIVGEGTYTRTSYESRSTITMSTPGGEMRIEADGSGRRTGDC